MKLNTLLIRQLTRALIPLTPEHLICAGQRTNHAAGGTF